MSQESFRVDLRGIVDILSHHLYSSPRVHLRELIQNAGDAVVARATFEPGLAMLANGGRVVVVGLSGEEASLGSTLGFGLSKKQALGHLGYQGTGHPTLHLANRGDGPARALLLGVLESEGARLNDALALPPIPESAP